MGHGDGAWRWGMAMVAMVVGSLDGLWPWHLLLLLLLFELGVSEQSINQSIQWCDNLYNGSINRSQCGIAATANTTKETASAIA